MTTRSADWYPDPLGTFDHRYWDGNQWTEHVATAGQQSIDPLTVHETPAMSGSPTRDAEESTTDHAQAGTAEADAADPDLVTKPADGAGSSEAAETACAPAEASSATPGPAETTESGSDGVVASLGSAVTGPADLPGAATPENDAPAGHPGQGSKDTPGSNDAAPAQTSTVSREITPDASGAALSAAPSPAEPAEEEPYMPEPAVPVNGVPKELPDVVTQRVGTFGAKRLATTLQELYVALHESAVTLTKQVDALRNMEATTISRLNESLRAEAAEIRPMVASLKAERDDLQNQILVCRERLSLEEMGLFDYEHPAEDSVSLATDLAGLRSDMKLLVQSGEAIEATENFRFNDSAAQGKAFVKQMSKIMLRAYNAEAENAVGKVKAGNLAATQKRLSTAREQISKQGRMIDLNISEEYHDCRLRELELAARHFQAVNREKALEKERRAELREQKKLEQEIAQAKAKLEKERSHYERSISKLKETGDLERAAELEKELARIDEDIAAADYRAANIRAGYVYVISNIGAFGEGVVKIGMTRRLEPMDRVRELGDASVPFTFDVHALFFSDDAVTVEKKLHHHFADQRLNKVNQRREFFRATPEQVLTALAAQNVSVLEFSTRAEAEDFRASWPLGYPTPDAR